MQDRDSFQQAAAGLDGSIQSILLLIMIGSDQLVFRQFIHPYTSDSRLLQDRNNTYVIDHQREVSNVADRILRRKEVLRVTGLGNTVLWELERAGAFPRRRQLSPRAVGWLESEVVNWIKTLPQPSEAADYAPRTNGEQ